MIGRVVLAVGCVLAQAVASAQTPRVVHPPGPQHGENPYVVVADWLKPFAADGFVWGSHPGIYVESPDRIFIIQRGELHVPDPKPEGFTNFYGSAPKLNALRPVDKKIEMRNVIFVVNRNGELIESWTQWDHLFADTAGPHKIAISPYDKERRVWVVNDARQQIHVFSNDGKKLLFSLGTWNEKGADETHFDVPQDVAFAKDGSIYVADGLGNSRVVKFDKNGKFVLAWGSKGTGPGQFDAVHGVAVDDKLRVYVADRSNDRIQVFTPEGRHLATWPNLNFPNHIVITKNQDVWVADNQPVRLIKFNAKGERLYSWDADGRGPGEFAELHEFGIDIEGNWYGADNILGRSQKFTPKQQAKKSQLMSEPTPLKK